MTFTGAPRRDVEFPALNGTRRMEAVMTLCGLPQTVLAIAFRRDAFPDDVADAVWQLDEFRRHLEPRGKNVIRILAANRLSAGARAALRHRGIGYHDGSGSTYLRNGALTIDIDRPSQPDKQLEAGSPFLGARAQVVHALLHRGDQPFTGQELAQVAQASQYTVSQTLQALRKHGWIDAEPSGRRALRRVAAASALLDAWADSWKAHGEVRTHWFYRTSEPIHAAEQIARDLRTAGLGDFAFTSGFAATALTQAERSTHHLQIVVPPGERSHYVAAAGLSDAEQQIQVTLIERAGASDLFRTELPERLIPVVGPFIVYLDLLRDGLEESRRLADTVRARRLKI